MPIFFLEYPRCSTCQRTRKQLDTHNVSYKGHHIKKQNPTTTELQEWHKKSSQLLKEFFNTSGLVYKDLQLKDKLPPMDEQKQFKLLSTDGMLAKQPLIIGNDLVLIGFKETEWEKTLL